MQPKYHACWTGRISKTQIELSSFRTPNSYYPRLYFLMSSLRQQKPKRKSRKLWRGRKKVEDDYRSKLPKCERRNLLKTRTISNTTEIFNNILKRRVKGNSRDEWREKVSAMSLSLRRKLSDWRQQ